MALSDFEDIAVFFEDFGVTASLTPSGGGDTETAIVIFDAPDEEILGGQSLSREYLITYASGNLPSAASGETVTISSLDYYIRDVRKIDDGSVIEARLSKL